MFGSIRRKKRQPAQPLTAATANSSATTAAAAAFGRRDSVSSLSSAAAAAALRARPTTPTNVADVQTRRMMVRRSASVSSYSSHPDTRPADLRRSPSQSSMSGRTFRSPSPSPHRAPAPATPAAPDAPPVPSIPDEMRTDRPAGRRKRPPANLHTQPFRVASEKTKDDQAGGGSWFGAATQGDPANVRTSTLPSLQTHQQQQQLADTRPGDVSPSSPINFSYPRGTQVGTPPPPASPVPEKSPSVIRHQSSASPRRTDSVTSRQSSSSAIPDEALVYDPNSRRMVPRADLLAREMSVRSASEKPVKRNKSLASISRSGSHLSKGTMARTSGTVVEEATRPPRQPAAPPSAEAQHPSRPRSPSTENGHAAVPAATAVPVVRKEGINGDVRPQQTTHAGENRMKSMSSPTPTSLSGPNSMGSKPASETRTQTERPHGAVPVSDREPIIASGNLEEKEKDKEERQARESTTQSAPTGAISASDAVDAVPVKSSPPLARAASVDRRSVRPASISPVRNARFSLTNDHLVVRHEPPPRSMSPRKSAMKNSTSPSRGASPSDEGSELSADVASRLDDQSLSRRKSVRVSFDDENTKVIDERDSGARPDSPPVARSPPHRNGRSWYDTMGGSRTSRPRDAGGPWLLDDDEIMKPRPALPSFGSIRNKIPRETEEERPLVRPHASSHSPPGSGVTARPHPPSDDDEFDDASEEVEEPKGPSSDHNIGSVLHQEPNSKHQINTSKLQEPLPPVVTSIEGSGYYSASSTDSEDDLDSESHDESEPGFDLHAAQEPALEPIQEMPYESNATTPSVEQDKRNADPSKTPASSQPLTSQRHEDRQEPHQNVPTIAITQPSPREVESSREDEVPEQKPSYFEVPGSFPQKDPRRTSNTNPPPAVAKAPNGVHPGPRSSHTATTKDGDSDSSDSDVYSDAYEDLSDIDEGGFMSLDAVVATPVSPGKVSRELSEEAPAAKSPPNKEKETPKNEEVSEPEHLSRSTEPSEAPAADDDWERAKAYWRSLSSEKRRQLEQEALGETASQAEEKAVDQTGMAENEEEQRRVSGVQQQQQPPPQQPQQQQAKRKQGAVDPQRVYQIPAGTKVPDSLDEPPSHMRKTLRAASEAQNETVGRPGGRRTTMRDGAEVKMSAPTKAPRPISLPQPPVSRQPSSKHKRHASLGTPASSAAMAAGLGAAATGRPSLHRRGSDSSESSFKRARPQRQNVGFHRSLRMATPEQDLDAQRSSRFSLRSISPPASPSPGAAGHRMSLRSTLRSDASDDSAHRMRVPTFGRRSGKKAAEKQRRSRFDDDSSDGEIDMIGSSTAFRSRFDVDSSDEEGAPARTSATMPKTLRQRASTPRAARGGSTLSSRGMNGKGTPHEEFHSSDDEDAVAVPQRTASGRTLRSQADRQGLKHKRSGRGELAVGVAPASSPAGVHETTPRHRGSGFFSVLRRRRDGSSGKISRPELRESAARQDTKLERSPEEISSLRNGHGGSIRLQKNRAANWPLLDGVEEEKRPATAGAAADAGAAKESPRSIFSKRRSASHGILGRGEHHPESQSLRQRDTETPEVDDMSQVDGSVKKKKKFGKLRKMFGLND